MKKMNVTHAADFLGLTDEQIETIQSTHPDLIEFVRSHPDASDDDLSNFAESWVNKLANSALAHGVTESYVMALAEQSAYFELERIKDAFTPQSVKIDPNILLHCRMA